MEPVVYCWCWWSQMNLLMSKHFFHPAINLQLVLVSICLVDIILCNIMTMFELLTVNDNVLWISVCIHMCESWENANSVHILEMVEASRKGAQHHVSREIDIYYLFSVLFIVTICQWLVYVSWISCGRSLNHNIAIPIKNLLKLMPHLSQ